MVGLELEKFTPRNQTEEDWLARRNAEISRDLLSAPEVGMLTRLICANATRTVRKLANESRFCQRGPLGFFLREHPEHFLAIKASPRFPKAPEKQIKFLARTIGAKIAGYEAQTGYKYLGALIERCELCNEKPAVIQLIRGSATPTSQQRLIGGSEDGSHTPEQCRYSTWPCPIHHPGFPPLSGISWCGTC